MHAHFSPAKTTHQRLLLPLVVLVERVQGRGDAKVGEQLARVARVLSQHQRRTAQHLRGQPAGGVCWNRHCSDVLSYHSRVAVPTAADTCGKALCLHPLMRTRSARSVMSSRLPMGVLTTYSPGDRGSSAAGRCSRVALPGSGPAVADALAAGPSLPPPPPLAAAAVAQGLTQRCCRLYTVCSVARKARKEVSCCTGAACTRRQRRAAAAAAGMLASGLDRQLELALTSISLMGPATAAPTLAAVHELPEEPRERQTRSSRITHVATKPLGSMLRQAAAGWRALRSAAAKEGSRAQRAFR